MTRPNDLAPKDVSSALVTIGLGPGASLIPLRAISIALCLRALASADDWLEMLSDCERGLRVVDGRRVSLSSLSLGFFLAGDCGKSDDGPSGRCFSMVVDGCATLLLDFDVNRGLKG